MNDSRISISLPCYCRKAVTNDSRDIVQCYICGIVIHKECFYGRKGRKKDKSRAMCFLCTLGKINPFEENDFIYLSPSFLPGKIEGYPKIILGDFSVNEDIVMQLRNSKNNRIYLACVQADRSFKTAEDLRWPERNFSIFLNGNKINLMSRVLIDVTIFIQKNNKLEFHYEELSKQYITALVGRKTVDISNILPKSSIDEEYFKLKLMHTMKDQMINEEKISMLCVFTNKIMKTPVRGQKCQHFQCFDLTSYIKINKIRKTFKCPICKKYAYLNELNEDLFFKKILIQCYSELKNKIEDYDVFINSKGEFTTKLRNFEKKLVNYNFDKESERQIERMNYSPQREAASEKPSICEEKDDKSVYNKIINISLELIKEGNSNFIEKLFSVLEKEGDNLNKISSFYIHNYILKFSLSPIQKSLIFPHQVVSNSTSNYHQLCKEVQSKYKIFFSLISLWTNIDVSIVELIIYTSTIKNKTNHYFALELLLGASWLIYKPKELEITLEYIIGRLLGIYCKFTNLSVIDYAHLINLMTNLFPVFYLPCQNFQNQKEKKNYFEVLIRFYCAAFIPFDCEIFLANVFKLLFVPPNEILVDEEYIFMEEMQLCFLTPLMERLQLGEDFVKTWDENKIFDRIRQIKI